MEYNLLNPLDQTCFRLVASRRQAGWCSRAGAAAASMLLGGLAVVCSPAAFAVTPAAPPTWTFQSPRTNPPARYGASMAYDAKTHQVVVFGGENVSDVFMADTWTWDGKNWKQHSPAISAPARAEASMAYDPATGQVILFGGYGGSGAGTLDDTWTWDGSDWTRQSPATSPPARYGASMAYDTKTHQVVVFGGLSESGLLFSDTWTWDGSDWNQQSPATSPPARAYGSMAFDPETDQVVLFAGGGGPLADTWTWDGTTWTQQSPVTSPPARYLASMAFDPGTDQIVLFGGISGTGVFLADTWTWDGTTWTQQSPSTSPPGRGDASIAYDQHVGGLLLFGGTVGNGGLADSWTYA